MCKDHFGFLENPFSIAPDPRYLYMSEVHKDGLAHLKDGLLDEACITLLTGETGTGKTILCRFFLDRLGPTANVALIVDSNLSAFEMLATACAEFQVGGTEKFYSTEHYLDGLNDFLMQAHAENNPAILVIDEAQDLDKDALEMVRLLTNLESGRHQLLKVILLGRPELAALLISPDLTRVNRRITGRFHIEGLDLEETANYIRHRLQVAGNAQKQLFEEKAIKKIHQLTGGVPRLINRLCDRSLLGASEEGRKRVETAVVRKAAKEIFGFDQTVKTIEIPVRSLILGAVALIVMVFFWVGSTSDMFYLNLERILSAPSDRGAAPSGLGPEEKEIKPGAALTEPAGGIFDTSNPPYPTADPTINSDTASSSASINNNETETAGQKSEDKTKVQNNIVIAPIEISVRRQPAADTKIVINGMEITE